MVESSSPNYIHHCSGPDNLCGFQLVLQQVPSLFCIADNLYKASCGMSFLIFSAALWSSAGALSFIIYKAVVYMEGYQTSCKGTEQKSVIEWLNTTHIQLI